MQSVHFVKAFSQILLHAHLHVSIRAVDIANTLKAALQSLPCNITPFSDNGEGALTVIL